MTYDPFGTSTPATGGGYDPLKDARFGWASPSGQAVATAVPGAGAAPVPATPSQAVPGLPPLAPAALVGVSVVLAVLAGAFGFAALEGVRLAAVADTIERARAFLVAAVVALVLDLAVLVWQVVLLVRGRWVASVVGVVLGLLPVVTVWLGLWTGADTLVTHLSTEVASGVDLSQALREAMTAAGVDRDWVAGLILTLLEAAR
ncbi:MAG: hypothetical protein Q4G45_00260 [Actinomycetia bacterium]|nr:hypothetical protein [Actinomycetes bacterium]